MEDRSIQSMGGEARDKSLSDKQKSDIAKKGAEEKWNFPKAKWGSPDKKLKLGDRELECYVLENGKRVLSGRGMQEALGLGQAHGGKLKDLLNQKAVVPFISADLSTAISIPMRFIRPGRGGPLAVGYEATILPDLCDAILAARRAGKMTGERQKELAKQCEIILSALSRVGITALVDEVTGYQEIRDREALQKILDKYLTDEWAKWSKTFPDEYYRELFRLKGMEYPTGKGKGGKGKPGYVGHWTNDIVYDRLAPGVLSELKKKNPRLPSGARARRHHQHFTPNYGHPALKEHLSNIVFLMKACGSDTEFRAKLNVVSPKRGETPELPLEYKTK